MICRRPFVFLKKLLLSAALALLPAVVTAQEPAGIAPSFDASAATDGSITLALPTPVPNCSGGGACECEVLWDTGSGGAVSTPFYDGTCSPSTNPTSGAIAGGQPYRFLLRFRDGGPGGPVGTDSPIVTFYAAGAPNWGTKTLSISKRGSNAVKLTWGPGPDSTGGSPILGYVLEGRSGTTPPALSGAYTVVYDGSSEPTVTQYIASGLVSGDTYEYRLYAINIINYNDRENVNYVTARVAASITLESLLAADQSYVTPVPPTPIPAMATDPTNLAVQAVDPVTSHLLAKPTYGQLSDNNDGTYDLSFTPMKVGKYSLLVYALEPGGLYGQYWDNQWFYGAPFSQIQDATVSFDWGNLPLTSFASDFVSIRWTGFVLPAFTEEYTFYLDVDDSARLWVDDTMIIDKWTVCCQEFWGKIALTQNFYTPIRIDYREESGPAKIDLLWSSFSQPKQTIPSESLFRGAIILNVPHTVQTTPSSFLVQAKDAGGNNRADHVETFVADFSGPSSSSVLSVPHVSGANDGLYRVDYVLTTIGTYTVDVTLGGVAIKDSSFTLTASPGNVSPPNCEASGAALTTFVAGATQTFSLQLKDAYDNDVLTDSAGTVTCELRWTGYTRSAKLAWPDDTAALTTTYGEYFTGTATYTANGEYTVSFSALRQGGYQMHVKIDGTPIKNSPFSPTCDSAADVYAPLMEIRDAYGNLIETNAALTCTVTIGTDTGTCLSTSGPVVLGVYDISITPTVNTGTQDINIRINGVDVDASPYSVAISPGAIDPTKCEATGVALRTSGNVAGTTYKIQVQLKDTYSNDVLTNAGPITASLVSNPTLIVTYIANGLHTPRTHKGLMAFCMWVWGLVGVWEADLVSTVAGTETLTIQQGGTDIKDFPFTNMVFTPGPADAQASTCTLPANFPAGESTSFSCTPADANSNAVNDANLYYYVELKYLADGTKVTASATYDSATFDYDFAATLTQAGTYSVLLQLLSPGGLIAQYYRTTALTAIVTPILTDIRHTDEPAMEYTRVDATVDFTWSAEPIATAPADFFSVRWSGYLLPTVAGLHSIRVTADSGVRLHLGTSVTDTQANAGIWDIDQFSSNAAASETITRTLVDGLPYPLTVDYQHQTGTSSVSLYWASTTFAEQIVPATSLLYGLNVFGCGDRSDKRDGRSECGLYRADDRPVTTITLTDGNTDGVYDGSYTINTAGTYSLTITVDSASIVGSPFSVTVDPAATHVPSSLVAGSGISTAEAGVQASFTVTLRDQYLNNRNTAGTDAVTATSTGAAVTCTHTGSGVFECTYTENTAGSVDITPEVNGGAVGGASTVTVTNKAIDPSSPTTYTFPSTPTLTPPINLVLVTAPTQSVNFQAQDELGNALTDLTPIHLYCLLEGPAPLLEQPLAVTDAGSGLFAVAVTSTQSGAHELVCSVAAKGGLNAQYFQNMGWEGVPALTAIDTQVDFNWGTGLVGGGSADYASARWDGYIKFPEAANFVFTCTADEMCQVWLDGSLVVDLAAAGTLASSPIAVVDTRLYPLQVSYYEQEGTAHISLEWQGGASGTPGPVESITRTAPFAAGTIDLQWVPHVDDGNSAITGYKVERDDGAAGAFTDVTGSPFGPGVTTFSDSDAALADYTKAWRYRITPTNTNGDGTQTTITLNSAELPGAPAAPTVTAATTTSLTLSVAHPGSTGGAVLTDYHVYYDNGDGGYLVNKKSGTVAGDPETVTLTGLDDTLMYTIANTPDGVTLTHTLTGLPTPGYTYWIAVAAVNSAGEGPLSPETPLIASAVPTEVQSPAVSSQSTTSMTISWSPPVFPGAFSAPVTGYLVYVDDGAGGAIDTLVYDGTNVPSVTQATYADTSIVAGNPYRFSVKAINAVGEGPLLTTPLTVYAASVPGPPSTPTAVAAGTGLTQITVQWSAVTGADTGGSPILNYELARDDSPFGSWDDSLAPVTSPYTDLEPGAGWTDNDAHLYRVRAVNIVGNGAWSTEATLYNAVVPTAPTLSYVSSTDGSMSLSWTAGTSALPILGYQLFADSVLVYDGSVAPSVLSYTHTGLTAGHTHTYEVTAISAAGSSSMSAAVNLVVGRQPYGPSAPVLTSASTAAISFTWMGPSTVTGVPITAYTAERATDPTSTYADVAACTSLAPSVLSCTDNTVSPGVVYQYRVYGVNGVGDGSVKGDRSAYTIIPASNPLAAPASLARDSPPSSSTAITATWSSVTGATGYRLYADTGLNDALTLVYDGTSKPSVLTYTHSGLITGRTYRFAVSTLDNAGEGAQSGIQSFLAASLPSAPTAVTLVSSSATNIQLSWSPPTSTGGASSIDYTVYWDSGGGPTDTLSNSASVGTATTYDITGGLSAGDFYQTQIEASVTGLGTSPRTPISTFVAASLPTGASLTASTSPTERTKTSIGLTWSTPSTGGSPITGFVLHRNDGQGGAGFVEVATVSPSATAYTVTGLTNGYRYIFKLTTVTAAGSTDGAATAEILCAGPPAQPSPPTLVSSDNAPTAAITVAWVWPADDGGSPITGMQVQYDSAGTWTDIGAAVTFPTATLTHDDGGSGLTAGTLYTYRIIAKNAVPLDSDPSTSATFIAANVPDTPTITLASGGQSKTALQLEWAAPAGNGDAPFRYTLTQDDGNGGDFATVYTGPALSYTASPLTAGLTYRFQLVATNRAGDSAASSVFARTAASLPGAPTGLARTASTCGGTMVIGQPATLDLAWNAPADNGGCGLVDYEVYQDGVAIGTTGSGATSTYSVTTGILCGTAYSFTVKAENTCRTGEFGAASAQLLITGGTLPIAPTGLAGVAGSLTSVAFSWNAVPVGLSTGGSAILGYRLYLNDGQGGSLSLVFDGTYQPTVVSKTVTNMVTGYTYKAAVSAVNGVGEGPQSTAIDVVMAWKPSAPTGVQVASTGATTVDVSWTASTSDGGSPLASYTVHYAPDPYTGWSTSSTTGLETTRSISLLTAGTSYQFKLTATNDAAVSSDFSTVVQAIAGSVPPAPDTLTRVSTSETTMTVQWTYTSPSDAPITGYRLYVDRDGSGDFVLAYDGSSSPSMFQTTVTNLVCGTAYDMRVVGVSSIGEGAVFAATLTLATLPGPPQNLQVTLSNTGQIDLSWDPPIDTGCAAISQYRIYRDTGSGFSTLATQAGATYSDAATVAGSGTLHLYRVAARNAAFTTEFGAQTASLTAFDATVPDQVTGLSITATSRTTATLSWSAPADGGAPITQYSIQHDQGLLGDFTSTTLASTALIATILGLSTGLSHRFRVAAVNAVGTGAYSAEAVGVVASVPGAPDAPTLASIAVDDDVRVTWAAPSDDGGSVITGYKMYENTVLDYDGTGAPATLTQDLKCPSAGATVSYTVSAMNAAGEGPQSAASTRTCALEPGAPINFALKVNAAPGTLEPTDLRTPTSLFLEWDPPAAAPTDPITEYVLYRDNGLASGTYAETYRGSVAEYEDVGLVMGRTYRYRVSAVNTVGEGAATAVTAFQVLCVPRSPPYAPTATSRAPTAITLTWSAPTVDVGLPVTDYRVYRDGTFLAAVGSSATTYTDSTTAGGTSYVYRVIAENSEGLGFTSAESASIIAAAVPSATTFSGATATATTVSLTWNAATANGSPVTAYRLYINDGRGGDPLTRIYSGLATTYTATGLVSSRTYGFAVSAVNGVGEGAKSAVQNAQLCNTPSVPRNLRVAYRDDDEIWVQWDAPTDTGGCGIDSYTVNVDTVDVSTQTDLLYKDTGKATDTEFDYNVRANGPSLSSAATSDLTVRSATAPQAVTGVSVTSATSTAITLSWTDITASPANGGSAVTSYRIVINDGLGGSTFAQAVSPDDAGTPATTTVTLVPGRYYLLKVAAQNLVTTGNALNDQTLQFSSEVATYAAETPLPPADASLSATRTQPGKILFEWGVSTDTRGSPITRYELYENSPSTAVMAITDAATRSHLLEGCTPTTVYDIKVRAENAVGWGAYTSDTTFTCAIAPDAPAAPTRDASTSTSITVDWVAPATNGCAITTYTLYRATEFGTFASVSTANVLTFADTGLTTGVYYRYKVTATNCVGESADSPTVLIPAAGIPSAATALAMTTLTRSTATAQWTAPADTGGSPIVLYKLWSDNGGGGGSPFSTLVWSGSTAYTTTLTFTTGTAYQLEVETHNVVNQLYSVGGARSAILSWSAAVPPDAPTALAVKTADRGTASITMYWEDPADLGGMGAITNFDLQMDDGLGGSFSSVYTGAGVVDGSGYSHQETGLTLGLSYRFHIRAETAAGYGSFSSIVSGQVCSAPSAPQSLAVVSQSTALMTVSWSAPSDNGGCTVTGYLVLAGTTDPPTVQVADVDSSTLQLSYVPGAGNTDYFFLVRAKNWLTETVAAISGTDSAVLQVVSASIPDAPVAPTRSASTATEITLAVTDPSTGGSPLITPGFIVLKNDGLGGTTYTDHFSGTEQAGPTIAVSGLTTGRQYCFKYAAKNRLFADQSIADSAANYSPAACFYAADEPDPPTWATPQVVAGSQTQTGLTLDWEAPGSSGGMPIAGYRVYVDGATCASGSAPDYLLYDGSSNPSATQAAVSSLPTDTECTFAVTAINTATYESALSATYQVRIAAAPSTPTNFAVDTSAGGHNNQVDLTWTASASTGGAAPVEYTIRWDNGNFGALSNSVTGISGTSHSVTPLTLANFYRFTIEAVNNVPLSSAASSILITQVCEKPDAPTPTFTGHTDTSVVINWTPPANTGGTGVDIVGYRVYKDDCAGGAFLATPIHDGGSGVLTYTATGLTAGATCKFGLTSLNSVYESVQSGPHSVDISAVPTAPGTPTLTSVTNAGSDIDMVIGWTTATSADAITQDEVFSDNCAGGPITNSEFSGAPAVAHTKTGIAYGAVCRFQIQASNSNGAGPLSGIATFVASVTPGAPQSFAYASSTATSITVTWAAPNPVGHANEATLDRYEVLYTNLDTAVGPTTVTISPTTLTATLTGLTTTHQYQISVRACTINECSSNAGPINQYCGSLPDAPDPLSVSASTSNDITLGWTFTGSNGGMSVTSYSVLWSNNNFATSTADTAVGTSYVFTCASGGGQGLYSFKAAATTSVGTGAYTSAISWFCANPPTAPLAAPAVASQSTTAITVTLATPTALQLNNAPHTGYVLYWNDGLGGTDYDSRTITEPSAITQTITDWKGTPLSAGDTYRIKYIFVSSAGDGAESAELAAIAATVPDTPAMPTRVVTTTSTSDTAIEVSWIAPSDGGSPLTAYRLSWKLSTGPTFTDIDVTQAVTSDSVTVPTPGSSYHFKVYATNAVGDSAYSDVLVAKAAGVPDQPGSPPSRDLASSSVSGATCNLALTWTAPTVVELNEGTLTGYYLYRNNGGATAISATPTVDLSTTPSASSTTITSLTTGTTYKVTLSVVNEIGESQQSSEASLLCAVVPDTPTTPAVTGVVRGDGGYPTGNGEISLSWVAPDNKGDAITNYRIEVTETVGSGASEVVTLGSASTSTTLTAANFGATIMFDSAIPEGYTLTVAAYNSLGWGLYSAATSTVYLLETPNAPANLRRAATAAVNTQIDLEWDVPTDTGGAANTDLTYEIYGGNDCITMASLSTTETGGPVTVTYTESSLAPGTSRCYKVRAKNLENTWSPFSLTVTLRAAQLPDPPTGLVCNSPAGGQLDISWTPPASDGGSPLTRYVVSYTGPETPGPYLLNSATSDSFTTLISGGPYTVNLYAENEVGQEPTGDSCSVTIS
ncbi:unnamed protein product [Vitrella brassicaformis CCMP3155]|uniref:Uncharacterized protein n=3 Tax=Vitrella brassicaformis TaxID=1169539 RepID=A0A0G4ELN7_VITBC|nr:unnamed protein product [Vitrella brassicaformis CCMP3155]|eukprot:CEL98343.1 unnamed protein product [Vitrella brassicaformis CCMP3155]